MHRGVEPLRLDVRRARAPPAGPRPRAPGPPLRAPGRARARRSRPWRRARHERPASPAARDIVRGRRGDQPGEHGLALAERAGVRAIVRGGPGDLVGQSHGEQVVRELRQRQVEQLRQLHERVGRRVDPGAVPVHPGSAHEVGRHLLLRAEVVVQARRAEPAGVGEGLDRRPAVPVAAKDRGGQREQLSASRLEAAAAAEPPGSELAGLAGRTLHHARSVGHGSRIARQPIG